MNTHDFQRIVELEIKQREEELCDKRLLLEARAENKRIAESSEKRADPESLLTTVNFTNMRHVLRHKNWETQKAHLLRHARTGAGFR